MKKIILFDLDGTLLDTICDIMDSMNYALLQCGLTPHTKEDYISYLGNGARVLGRRALGDNLLEAEQFDKFLDIYLGHYESNRLNKTKEFSGASECLKDLKSQGYLLGVISNKPQADTRPIVEHYFPQIFDAIYGQTEEFPKKPNPKIIEIIADRFQILKDEMIYVGDSITDYQFAINAKIDYLLVDYGYEDPKFIRELRVIGSLQDINKFI